MKQPKQFCVHKMYIDIFILKLILNNMLNYRQFDDTSVVASASTSKYFISVKSQNYYYYYCTSLRHRVQQ